ncbi:MAG: TetR/AcrR family transcriptional regulator [Lawsonibacter sp.]
MPTSTFFRLPEEKRQRLLDAAWEEFSRTSYSDASINQIIHNAHIPRGSFYQYFEDKKELFWYLQGEIREYFFNIFQDALWDVGGDLFKVPIRVFDRFISRQGSPDPVLARFIQVVRLNQGMDFQHFLAEEPGLLPERFLEQVKLTGFREKNREFIDHVFFLTVAPLAYAIMETLRDPEQWKRQRNMLQARIEIIRHGSLSCEEE